MRSCVGSTDEQKSPRCSGGGVGGPGAGNSTSDKPSVHPEGTTGGQSGQGGHGAGTPGPGRGVAAAKRPPGCDRGRLPLTKRPYWTTSEGCWPLTVELYRQDVRIRRKMPEVMREALAEGRRRREIHAVKRGKLTGWNSRVRSRLLRLVRNLPAASCMLTLTHAANYPRDRNTCQRQFKRLLQAMMRMKWVSLYMDLFGVWVLEAQKRGAPHWHLLVYMRPRGDHEYSMSQGQVNCLVYMLRPVWYRIVGSGDPEHLKGGVHGRRVRHAGKAESYMARELGKNHQKDLPEGWDSFGRQWGTFGHLPRPEPVNELKGKAALECARIAIRARRAKSRAWGGTFRWNGGGATVYGASRVLQGFCRRKAEVTTSDRGPAAQAEQRSVAQAGDGGGSV